MNKEKEYNISDHLNKINDKELLRYFNGLRERISALGEDVEERIIN